MNVLTPTCALRTSVTYTVKGSIDEGILSAEFIALSTIELKGVKFHLPANQKLGRCCFRLNYAILRHARSLLSNTDARAHEV